VAVVRWESVRGVPPILRSYYEGDKMLVEQVDINLDHFGVGYLLWRYRERVTL